ncbi:hypothetical protein [Streptomyces sp. NPDC001312]|uniref:hypothetical protein n=1 Tax=Streptomyces sp. NPDC001312 TaxID=3364561 RepID=UPI0036B7BB76
MPFGQEVGDLDEQAEDDREGERGGRCRGGLSGGKTVAWHVEVTDGQGTAHEVTVDAQTGKVAATHTGPAHSRSKSTDDDREDD